MTWEFNLKYLFKSFARVVAGLFVLLWASPMSGCRYPTSSAAKSMQLTAERTLRVGVFGELRPRQPTQVSSGFESLILLLVYEGLVTQGADGDAKLQLAAKLLAPNSENQLEAGSRIVELRQNVRFHDGSLLTVDDVKTAIHCAKSNPQYSWASSYLRHVTKVEALSASQLKLHFRGNPHFAMPGLEIPILSAAENSCALEPTMLRIKSGTGPFTIAQWLPDKVVLKRFPGYWRGQAQIENIVFEVCRNKTEAWSKLIRSEIDVFTDFGSHVRPITANQPHLKIVSYPMRALHMLMFNMNKPLLRSPDLRRGLNMAVNRQAIIHRLFDGEAELSSGVIHPLFQRNSSSVNPFPYNPKEALRLFKRAGYDYNAKDNRLSKNGQQLTLVSAAIKGDVESKRLMLAVQSDLQDVGIRLIVETLSTGKIAGQISDSKFDIVHFYADASSDPGELHRRFSGGSDATTPYISNSMVQLFQSLASSENFSQGKFLEDFGRIIKDEPPGIFLYWKHLSTALNVRVVGAAVNPGNYWGDITRWHLDNSRFNINQVAER